MHPFCKLRDPDSYVACDWDLTSDPPAREYWIGFFIDHFRTIVGLGAGAAAGRGEALDAAQARARACIDDFNRRFNDYRDNPAGRVTILTLDEWRDQALRAHGFDDCFADLKQRENEAMLPLLPRVCAELDAHRGADQLQDVIKGVFAGNIFDMGAKATAARFLHGGPDFFHVRDNLPARPWLIDDFDALLRRWSSHTYRKAVVFIDNAGSDFLLGALPLVRWLALRGTRVVIAANQRPTLNDMTIHEVHAWWPRILRTEPSLADLPIDLVSTGTGEPLIDLSLVSDALNAAAADADLVVLEGMGRGVETNLHAEFTCDALNIAMLKDESVARRIGGKIFDVVCRFR